MRAFRRFLFPKGKEHPGDWLVVKGFLGLGMVWTWIFIKVLFR